MSLVTTKLKDIIVNVGGRDQFVNFCMKNYPIFDETHRNQLNQKIIDHYYFREIGMETVEIFLFSLARKLNEVMPLYNQFYYSESIKFDPLSTIDINSVTTASNSDSSENSSNSNSDNKTTSNGQTFNQHKVFPSTPLSNVGDYATEGDDATSATTGEATATATGVSTAENHARSDGSSGTTGRQGPAQDLIQSYRDLILNIDMSVVNDMAECFIGVWSNGDSTNRKGNYNGGIGSYWPVYQWL